MQSVTYQSGGREITFSLSPPYIFEKAEGLHGMETLLLTSESPWLDGTKVHSLRLPDRQITLSFQIEGKDRADMYKKRMEAMNVLRPEAGGDGRLVYRNDAGSWWIPALVKQAPTADGRQRNFNHCTVVFLCPDPYWRSMELAEASLGFQGGGLTFPIELGKLEFGEAEWGDMVRNEGDGPAPLHIRVYGPAKGPKISKGLDAFIRVNTALEEGESLDIYTGRGDASVTINRKDGRKRSGFGYLDLDSVFFQLDPGWNLLRYDSDDDGVMTRVEVSYYSMFGGV